MRLIAMTRYVGCFSMLTLSVITGVFTGQSPFAAEDLRLFVLDQASLMEAKHSVRNGYPPLLPAYKKLISDADRALKGGPVSVIDKEMVPPSGDKQDYMSVAPYWWPNPETRGGLPYVRHDGKINPEAGKIPDKKQLGNLVSSVRTLALAYFFSGDENYASHAAMLLRVWFIDEATRMNPNLRYGQAIPGKNDGRAAGIIETHNLSDVVDAIGLLQGSKAWRQVNENALRDWFNAYLEWLLESSHGATEAKASNNHGSWYDVQVAAYALFVQRQHIATRVLIEISAKRIARQIESDGRQPRELERSQPWSYSLFNLEALFNAASLGDKIGIDLWNFETADNRGIRKALNWLLPFATGDKPWSYREISGWRRERLVPLLRRAAIRYRDPSYEAAIRKLSYFAQDARERILYSNSSPEATVAK